MCAIRTPCSSTTSGIGPRAKGPLSWRASTERGTSYDMAAFAVAASIAAGLCAVLSDVPAISAQSGGTYKVDANWARLPTGTTWNGNTSWITTDGKGQVMVLVRTAPYFRVLTRDGAFVSAFGDDGLFESAHSVTIDAQGALWVTDSAAHVVHKLSREGRLLMTLGRKGVAGDNTARDLFNQPNHVADCTKRRHLRVRRVRECPRRALLQGRTIRPHHRRRQGVPAGTAPAPARRGAGFHRPHPGQRQRQSACVGL